MAWERNEHVVKIVDIVRQARRDADAGNRGQARGRLEDALRTFPHSLLLHAELGDSLLRLRAYDRAAAEYLEAARCALNGRPGGGAVLEVAGELLVRAFAAEPATAANAAPLLRKLHDELACAIEEHCISLTREDLPRVFEVMAWQDLASPLATLHKE